MTGLVVAEKSTVVVVTETGVHIVTVGIQGPEGMSISTARRHAWASPHDYAATAPAGTADSASGWTIARVTVAADGTTTVAHATGAWTDRATLTYT